MPPHREAMGPTRRRSHRCRKRFRHEEQLVAVVKAVGFRAGHAKNTIGVVVGTDVHEVRRGERAARVKGVLDVLDLKGEVAV